MVRRVQVFAACRSGVAAVEFALVLPVLLAIVFGGYQMAEATSAYRKTTLTAHAVADLTTQYTTMDTADVLNVLNASAQVMAPFATSSLVIVLTEYATSVAGVSTVTWSKSLNGTPLVAGTIVLLPASVAQVGTSIVQSQVTYSFTPAVAYKLTGPINMSSQLYMSPRSVQSIPYTGS